MGRLMVELTPEAKADFVAFNRGKTYENTQAMLSAYHEWVADSYGEAAVMVNGKPYPPGTRHASPFRGSILWTGDTTEERRAIKRDGLQAFMDAPTKLPCGHESVSDYCETCSMAMVESAQAQLDKIKNRKGKAA